MTKSIIAVCVGAPLLALGFGAAPAAWAAPGDHGASVSVNGDPKHTSAGSTADSGAVGDHNVAVAVNGSNATANLGTGNKAIAVNDSFASANTGDNNTALATNGGCAIATGDGATDRQHGSSSCGQ